VNASWRPRSSAGVDYYEYSPDPRLLLAFFTRRGGVSRGDYDSLNTSFAVGDEAQNVERNLELARRALVLPAILTLRQTHSDTVLTVADRSTQPETLEGDACCTRRAGLGLGLKVADCLPVYFYCADLSCIGIAHCGWRGTAARIAEKTARRMSRDYSLSLPSLRFALGPCICPNCYEVGDDVRKEFGRNFPEPDRFFSPVKGAKYLLDIRAANRWLLTEVGLTEAESLNLCTREDEKLFYSVRRDCPDTRTPGATRPVSSGKRRTVPRGACVEHAQGTVGSGAVQSPVSATGRNLAVIALR
jgi:YfiH family protein